MTEVVGLDGEAWLGMAEPFYQPGFDLLLAYYL